MFVIYGFERGSERIALEKGGVWPYEWVNETKLSEVVGEGIMELVKLGL